MLVSSAFAQTTFTKVTSADQLVDGGRYIIVATDATLGTYAMGGQKTNNRAGNLVTVNGNTISATEATANSTAGVDGEAVVLTLGIAEGNASYYTLFDGVNSGYLYAASSSSNYLKTQANNDVNGEWDITFNGDVCSIIAAGSSNRNVMQFNKNVTNGTANPLFSCYTSADPSKYSPVCLYVDESSLSSEPSLTIVSPAPGAFILTEEFEVRATIRNVEPGEYSISARVEGQQSTQYFNTPTFTMSLPTDNIETTIHFELLNGDVPFDTPVTCDLTVNYDPYGTTVITIPTIQGTEDANAYNDQAVTTEGIVTAKTNYGFYIQSALETYSGLYVYSPDYMTQVELGDFIRLRGTMTEYNGLTEMGDVVALHILNRENTLWEPVEIMPSQAAEQYEGMIVTVTGTHNGTKIGGAWQIANGNETIYVGADCYEFTPAADISYTVTGVLSYSNKENYNVGWVVLPRSSADIDENVEGVVLRVLAPVNDALILADSVNVDFRVYNFDLGVNGKLKYTLNGGEEYFVETEASFIVRNLANGSNTLAFELVDMEEVSLETPVTTSVTFSARTDGTLAIRDIQYTEDPSGESPYVGQTVTVSGIVTGLKKSSGTVKGYYIQDEAAAWSAVYVYASSNVPACNDSVKVTGNVSEYYGLTEISQTSIVNNGAGSAMAGVPVSVSDMGEAYESVLVTVSGVCTAITNSSNWTLSDGTPIKIYGLTYTPTVGTSYTVTGIAELNTYNNANEWEIKPREAADVIEGSVSPAIVITNPANGSTIYTSAVTATVQVFNFSVETEGSIAFSIDSEEAVSGTELSHSFTGLTDGQHTIHASLIGTDNTTIATTTSTFTVSLAGPTFTSIRDIQYTTDESGDSPLKNQTVWVKGVVTSNFINTPYRPVKGYSIQDEIAPWSGIWVFDSINNPAIGDSVKFQALVTEYYGLTELKNVTNYEMFDMGIATPIDVTINEANSEAYEGCYVRVECARSTGSTMPYGNWNCVNAAGDTVAYSHNFSNDAYTIEKDRFYSAAGIVEYSYSKWYVNYPSVNDITADCDASVDVEMMNSLEIYPNPTSSIINIVNAEGQTVVVLNALGQVVASIENATENQQVDLSNVPSGTYFVKVNGNVAKVSVIR